MANTERIGLDDILLSLNTLNDLDLQTVMAAIQKRYADTYPDWEVFYLALHKDPVLRKKEMELLLGQILRGLDWEITIRATE